MKKILTVFILFLIVKFLLNILVFEPNDGMVDNLIEALVSSIVVIVVLIILRSELLFPQIGSREEFWKAIRKAVGKK